MTTGHSPSRTDTAVVGRRIAAHLLDNAVVVGLTFLILLSLAGLTGESISTGMAFVMSLVVGLVYGTILEGYRDGQTVGKGVLGIRVVDDGGEPPSVGQAFIRNFPVIFTFSTVVLFVTLAAIAQSDRRQRLFDRVAETYVVKA